MRGKPRSPQECTRRGSQGGASDKDRRGTGEREQRGTGEPRGLQPLLTVTGERRARPGPLSRKGAAEQGVDRGGTRAGGDKARPELIITSRVPGKVRVEGGVQRRGKRNSSRIAWRAPVAHPASESQLPAPLPTTAFAHKLVGTLTPKLARATRKQKQNVRPTRL